MYVRDEPLANHLTAQLTSMNHTKFDPTTGPRQGRADAARPATARFTARRSLV